MSDDLPENWRRGRFHGDDEPHYEHEYLHAELRIVRDELDYDADGRPLPDGERRTVYRIWIENGVPFAGQEVDFEAPDPITDLDEATDWGHALMQQMEVQFSLENHHYVDGAMNAVLGTDEYVGSGTYDVEEDYACPICGVPFDLFRGRGTREQMENHLEYADDEQHEGYELVEK